MRTVKYVTQGPGTGTARRWWALGWISVTQLMMVVDGTVMNIAVPSAQAELGLSDVQRQWAITVYVLSFGAMLLMCGRVSDVIGRRRALLIGLVGFTLASVAGGLAVNAEMLIAARAVQGVFGALVTPSAMALLSVTFPEGADRAKAFGVYGTIMGAGSGIGVLLGGTLTGSWGWRWALLINVPIAVVAGIGLWSTLTSDASGQDNGQGRIDVAGGLLSAVGLTALTLGFTAAESSGWASPVTIGLLAVGVAVLAGFVLRQHQAVEPLLPLALFGERLRCAAFAAMLAWGVAILPAFLFLSVYLQQILRLSPLITGLGFLPYTAAILITVRLVRPALRLLSPRVFLAVGLGLLAAGLLLLTRIEPDSSYWTHVLPVFVLLGLGTGCVQPAANSAATHRAGPNTAVAGAVGSTAQQVGSSLGLALLGTIAATTTTTFLAGTNTAERAEATLAGYHAAALTGAVILALAALVVYVLAGRPTPAPSIPSPPVSSNPGRNASR